MEQVAELVTEPVSIQSPVSFEIPWLTCIIPTYGPKGIELTRNCITSLQKHHQYIMPETLVVSDGDDGEVLEALKSMATELHFGLARIDRRGFASACNAGIRLANGQLGTVLINNDIEFENNCLQVLVDAMITSGAGIAGCRLLYPDRRIQHAGVVYVPAPAGSPVQGYFDHYLRFEYENHIDAVVMRRGLVTGALLAINRDFIERSGYLDERFGFTAEDIDLCLRAFECGMPPVYCGYAYATHMEGASRGRTLEEKMKMEPEVAAKEQASLSFLFRKYIGVGFDRFSVRDQIGVAREE